MHNGAIAGLVHLKRHLYAQLSDAAIAGIGGSADSELFAALYMTLLTSNSSADSDSESGDAAFEKTYPVETMQRALRSAISLLITLQQQILGPARTPNSLNICVTDGVSLVAYRFRNHAVEQPPSLYYSTSAGPTLNRKYPDNACGQDTAERFAGRNVEGHGPHVVVASEPMTYRAEDWTLLGRNCCLMVGEQGGCVVRGVEYGEGWDAEDPDF